MRALREMFVHIDSEYRLIRGILVLGGGEIGFIAA